MVATWAFFKAVGGIPVGIWIHQQVCVQYEHDHKRRITFPSYATWTSLRCSNIEQGIIWLTLHLYKLNINNHRTFLMKSNSIKEKYIFCIATNKIGKTPNYQWIFFTHCKNDIKYIFNFDFLQRLDELYES